MSKQVFPFDGMGHPTQVFMPINSMNTVDVTSSSTATAVDDYSCYTLMCTDDFYYKLGGASVTVAATTGSSNGFWPGGVPKFIFTGANTYIALIRRTADCQITIEKNRDLTPPA